MLWFLSLFFFVAYASPPADPISCSSKGRNCTVVNSYGAFSDRATCTSAMVVYPATEDELLYVVSEGAQARQKMRVVTRFSHSMTRLACADGEKSRLISTEYLNKTLRIDRDAMTITVQEWCVASPTHRGCCESWTRVEDGTTLVGINGWWNDVDRSTWRFLGR
uniref:Uncharacterized protein n=1 Tax=Noccaea caerulescens TaxID=107243 RepID=A0A1J3J6M3_NOCCA